MAQDRPFLERLKLSGYKSIREAKTEPRCRPVHAEEHPQASGPGPIGS